MCVWKKNMLKINIPYNFFLLEKNNNTETHRLALKVGSQQYYR